MYLETHNVFGIGSVYLVWISEQFPVNPKRKMNDKMKQSIQIVLFATDTS